MAQKPNQKRSGRPEPKYVNTSIRVERDLLERFRRVAAENDRSAGAELRVFMRRAVAEADLVQAA